MLRRLAVVIVFVVLAAPRLALGAEPPYYLALGDSLSRGVQPLLNGTLVETRQGYVDDVYGALRLKHPFLRLKKLGCSGETTTTMWKGGVCQYPAGNQVDQAVAFILTHRVALITITIGGDNILQCISRQGDVDPKCVQDGLSVVISDLGQILLKLRGTAGYTGPIVAGNYYDPFLAASVLLPAPKGPMLALDSLLLTQQLNGFEEATYAGFGVKVADVAGAFRITNFSLVPGINIPWNAFLELVWTWIGAPPPRGPDIHPNAAGYAVIAGAFLKVIGTF